MHDDELDDILEQVDPSRRSFIKRVAIGTAIGAPVITTFSMTGFGVGTAAAGGSNLSPGGPGPVSTTSTTESNLGD